MMYGWRNPNTGTREQDQSLESAKWRLWHELQESAPRGYPHAESRIWALQPIGESSRTGTTLRPLPVDTLLRVAYFWASPANALASSSTDGDIVSALLAEEWKHTPEGPYDTVIVYQGTQVAIISANDPQPPAPTQEVYQETPESLLEAVKNQAVDLGHAQTMAMLWIAHALQKAVGALQPASESTIAAFLETVEPELFMSEEQRAEMRARAVKERNGLR